MFSLLSSFLFCVRLMQKIGLFPKQEALKNKQNFISIGVIKMLLFLQGTSYFVKKLRNIALGHLERCTN